MTCPNLPVSLPKVVPSPSLFLPHSPPLPALYQCSFLHFPEFRMGCKPIPTSLGCPAAKFLAAGKEVEKRKKASFAIRQEEHISSLCSLEVARSNVGARRGGNEVDSVWSPSPSHISRVENSSMGLGTRWKLSWRCELAGSFPVERPGVNQGPSQ